MEIKQTYFANLQQSQKVECVIIISILQPI